jgi:hypothetical protein
MITYELTRYVCTCLLAVGRLNDSQIQDRVMVNIPHFTVSANSANFAALYNVISDLLLYHTSTQQQYNEALEKFVYLFDFRDRQSAANVVARMQFRIRQLRQAVEGYEINMHGLNENEKLDLLAIKSQLFAQSQELKLIFEGIARAQAKVEDDSGNDSFAVRLDAESRDLSWHMLDERNHLLSKLVIRGTQYTWISRTDGSMSNNLTVRDLQALDASPEAIFPEMLIKQEASGSAVSILLIYPRVPLNCEPDHCLIVCVGRFVYAS